MSSVLVTIAGRNYRMACDDGEEARLEELAKLVEGKILAMREGFGDIGEQRVVVMAAIAIADEGYETRKKLAALEEQMATQRAQAEAQTAATQARAQAEIDTQRARLEAEMAAARTDLEARAAAALAQAETATARAEALEAKVGAALEGAASRIERLTQDLARPKQPDELF